ncbi:hypothetical protein ACIBG8_37055 [Nonomuraea sp. NPDC050556]|uniref:hypothetical protein n=1 Tax=Nonomuraea sp. NPDC050556 TaxID=3364369 RepID=UPI00379A0774
MIRTQLLKATAAGVLLPLVIAAATIVLFAVTPCAEQGCFSVLDGAGERALWIAAFLGWPLLYLVRVRPAWPVAVMGALFMMVAWPFVAFPFDAVAGVVAYPAAVLISVRR